MPKKSKSLPAKASLGKIEKPKPTTIDQVLGDIGENKYRFLQDPFSEECYANYLNSMLPSDLYHHAASFGFSYTENKNLVIRKLIDQFRLDRAQYKTHEHVASTKTEKDLSPEMLKFLAGAR